MTYVAQALAAVESAEEQHRRGDRTAPFSPRFLALVRDDLDRMAASPNYQPTYPRFALDRPDSTGREMARFVFLTLKAASSPITFHEITQAQIKARGLKADDDTFVLMRKRVGACLTAQQEKRLVRSIPQEGPYKGWELIHSQAARADPFHQRRPSLRDRASLAVNDAGSTGICDRRIVVSSLELAEVARSLIRGWSAPRPRLSPRVRAHQWASFGYRRTDRPHEAGDGRRDR